jgi:hypothetical protein
LGASATAVTVGACARAGGAKADFFFSSQAVNKTAAPSNGMMNQDFKRK